MNPQPINLVDELTIRERSILAVAKSVIRALEANERNKGAASGAARRWFDLGLERHLFMLFDPDVESQRDSIRQMYFGGQTLSEAQYLEWLELSKRPSRRTPWVRFAADQHGGKYSTLLNDLVGFAYTTGSYPLNDVERHVVLGQLPSPLMAEVSVEPIPRGPVPSVVVRIFHPELVRRLRPLLREAYSEDETQEIMAKLIRRLPGRGDQASRRRQRYMTPRIRVMYLTCWLLTNAGGGDRTTYGAEKTCEREFDEFVAKDYENALPKLLDEFEQRRELERAFALDKAEGPIYWPLSLMSANDPT